MPELIIHTADGTQRVPFEGERLLYELISHLPDAPDRPCGGGGVCGACRVIARGSLSARPDIGRRVLACQTYVTGNAEVWLPRRAVMTQIETRVPQLPKAKGAKPGIGAAVDLGTTTIVLRLVDTATGDVLSTVSCENPQRVVAADVIGRIDSAVKGGLGMLTGMIGDCIDELEKKAFAQAKIKGRADVRVIAGNTTMLYLYAGRDPEPLSHAPFAADCLFGHKQGRDMLPACMGAFVGADITCAILAAGICSQADTVMLTDIGTNGEIVLWHKGKLYCCATAAGPAFEGAGISCGVGSVPGAIDRAWVQDGGVAFETIGGEPACGVCGSGLIDIVAALLDAELMDETGALEDDEVILADGVTLTQQDIRQVQLAKGAISAGMQALMKRAGVTAADVKALYIAGGFGSHLNLAGAARIGLIPPELADKAQVLGNASLGGAQMLATDPEAWQESCRIAAMAQCINLAEDADFSDLFIENMMFE